MKHSLIKTAKVITGMGGKLSIEFLRNGIAKLDATIGERSVEVLSTSTMGKIEKSAAMLLDQLKSPAAAPNIEPHELDAHL